MSSSRGSSSVTGSGSGDIVRIAVTNSTVLPLDGTHRPQNYLMQLSKSVSLSQVVRDLCQYWGIEGGTEEMFGLRFESSDEYVTETSKKSIKDGTILKLCPSAKCLAKDIVDKLKSDDDALCLKGCLALQSVSGDFVVIDHFISFGGLKTMLDFLNETRTLPSPSAQLHCETALLCALVEIMKHEDTPYTWDDDSFGEMFILRISQNICTFIEGSDKNGNDVTRLKQSLVILENLCQSNKKNFVQEAIPVRSLLRLLLLSDDCHVQRVVLSLYNALFNISNRDQKTSMRRTMEELNIRNVILTKILIHEPSMEMKRQLFITQCNLFDEAAHLMRIPIEAQQDQKALEKIKELRRLAFNPEMSKASNAHRGRFSEDYKSLGFNSTRDPTQDFRSVPPGMLALDLMFSFAQNQTDCFSKMTIENSYRIGDNNHACPFAASSIALTKLMCESLHIGEEDLQDIEVDLQPMLFSQESPLDTMFSITIQHLFKTWREMRATSEDFDKVIEVTKEQLTSGLKNTPTTFEEFRRSLKTYSQVSDSWKEAAKSRGEQESQAVEELRQILMPEMINLVQRQRLGFIVEGTRFTKLRREGGSRHLFVKLNPNHKTLYYGDWNESDATPTIDNLSHKTSVSDIKDLLVGPDSASHLAGGGRDVRRNRGVDNTSQLAMSILTDNASIDLLAPDQKTFDYWCDAINALLRRDMVSNKAVEDVELFLSMEIKIRLLDVEGISLPKVAPVVPPPPPPIGVGRYRQ